jgi:hypothetical protein
MTCYALWVCTLFSVLLSDVSIINVLVRWGWFGWGVLFLACAVTVLNRRDLFEWGLFSRHTGLLLSGRVFWFWLRPGLVGSNLWIVSLRYRGSTHYLGKYFGGRGRESAAWVQVTTDLDCCSKFLFGASTSDRRSSTRIFWIVVSWRKLGQSSQLDAWAPEQLTYWTRRGQMVSPRSFALQFGHKISDL